MKLNHVRVPVAIALAASLARTVTAPATITSDMLKKLRPFKQIAALGGSAAFASTLLISSATPSFASQFVTGKYTDSLLLSRSEVRKLANTGEIDLINEVISLIPIPGLSLPGKVFKNYVDSAARQNKCLQIPFSKGTGVGVSPRGPLGFFPYNGRPFRRGTGGPLCQE